MVKTLKNPRKGHCFPLQCRSNYTLQYTLQKSRMSFWPAFLPRVPNTQPFSDLRSCFNIKCHLLLCTSFLQMFMYLECIEHFSVVRLLSGNLTLFYPKIIMELTIVGLEIVTQYQGVGASHLPGYKRKCHQLILQLSKEH